MAEVTIYDDDETMIRGLEDGRVVIYQATDERGVHYGRVRCVVLSPQAVEALAVEPSEAPGEAG